MRSNSNSSQPGRLASINVCEGQQVRAGELLATLDASIWQHQLAQAEASLALAVAERERLVNGQRPETREVAEAEVRVAEVRAQQAHGLRADLEAGPVERGVPPGI